MKMKTKFLTALAALAILLPSCTKLNRGDSFTQTVGGIEYSFEVLVSKMTYVRLTPVTAPSALKGSIVLPASAKYDGVRYVVTQIGEGAFRNCTGITSVTLPRTLSQIEKEAFAGCTSLREINTPQPLSVIGDYAFDGCVSLKAFSLEASISELGIGAFRDCASLTQLEFTPTFTAIPDELCCGCTGLTKIDLPSTIMSVGNSAFEDCAGAKSISIDRSLQTIGTYGFAGCTSVTSITCLTATPPACAENTFEGVRRNVPVTVPMASIENYMDAAGWAWFDNFIGKY